MFSILNSSKNTNCGDYYKYYKNCVIQTVSKDIEKCDKIQEKFVNCLLNTKFQTEKKNIENKL